MSDSDVFLYSGPMQRVQDLRFINFVDKEQRHKNAILILASLGGDPDAAYKIGKYLQERYDSLKVVIAGLCKSAGTLLAVAAEELIFLPYGELGPLDIQLAKTDHVSGLESGLSILQAFSTLQGQAKETYHDLVSEIIGSTGGIVSYQTASHCAAEIVSGLYGPIFSKIDPDEVGSKTRSMQIAAAYGHRLNVKFENLKPTAIDTLAQTYPSHAFVIDLDEAQELFKRTRVASDEEKRLVEAAGHRARFPSSEVYFECLTGKLAEIYVGETHDESATDGAEAGKNAEEGSTNDDEGNRQGAVERRGSSGNEATTAVANGQAQG